MRTAWAINTRSKEGHGFVGIWWWDPTVKPLLMQEGQTTALFKTRAKARALLPAVKRAHRHARVEKVVIRIKPA